MSELDPLDTSLAELRRIVLRQRRDATDSREANQGSQLGQTYRSTLADGFSADRSFFARFFDRFGRS